MKLIFPSASEHSLEKENNTSFWSLLFPPWIPVVHDLLHVFTDEGVTGNVNPPPLCSPALFSLSTTWPSHRLLSSVISSGLLWVKQSWFGSWMLAMHFWNANCDTPGHNFASSLHLPAPPEKEQPIKVCNTFSLGDMQRSQVQQDALSRIMM